MRRWTDGGSLPSAERALIERARAALDVTPLSVAAAEGLDAAGLTRLRRGGDGRRAQRLAAALRRRSAELRALAEELSAAARVA